MSTIRLEPRHEARAGDAATGFEGLASSVLLRNVWWFIRLRWLIIALFVATGLLGLIAPGFFGACGMHPPALWPWILAAALTVTDLLFRWDALRLNETSPRARVKANIMVQIVTDLLVATVLVHIVGSTHTFIPFIYLFHIALACLFFTRGTSLFVTLLASALYLGCVVLEQTGLLHEGGHLINIPACPQGPIMTAWYAASAVFIWFVMWYLVSALSVEVRKRDQRLFATNEQLRRADEEKTRRVLQTAHELKAPFSGIESNIQVLRAQHWQELSEPVRALIERVERRGQRLRRSIQGILELGDLRSRRTPDPRADPVDLGEILLGVVEASSELAKSRKVKVSLDTPPAFVTGNKEQYALLFANLLSNAVSYSHEGGQVRVTSSVEGDHVIVSVEDQGIGISKEALEHIFEEYYRSREAAKFNRLSTGIGMAIVKEVAQNFGLEIDVTSEQDRGTTVRVSLPGVMDKLT